MRTKLGALLGAGGLLLMAASATIAAPPTYTISVSKTAQPASVPLAGGTVAFTVWVTATGTGFFQQVNVSDPLAGCTLGAAVETSGDGDSNLETGETWSYSCSVDNVTPGTQNTATVNACHNGSGACNQSSHDATGQGSVTVTEGAAPTTAPTSAPTSAPTVAPTVVPTVAPTVDPTVAPTPTMAPSAGPTEVVVGTPNPTQDTAGLTSAPTDMVSDGISTIGSQRSLLLVISLGMLLASLILVTPARPAKVSNSER